MLLHGQFQILLRFVFVFFVDVLCTGLETDSRPGLCVWKYDLLSWLGPG